MRLVSIGLTAVVFLGLPCEIYGGNLRLGPLRITPFVTASGTYTDNVFLTKRNKKSDFYYSILPGVKVRAKPIGGHNFHLDYDADISQFSSYSGADYVVQSLDAGLDLNLPRGVGLKLGDRITYGADLPDFKGDKSSQYLSNLAQIEASSTFFDRFGLGLRYSHGLKDYERRRDEIDNCDTNTVGGVFRIRILRGTSMLAEYVYSITDYQKDNRAGVENNYSNRINTGITWDITAKTRGTVRAGYLNKRYYRVDREDDVIYASADISHELTNHIVLSITGVHDIFDTSNADNNIQYSSSYRSNQVTATLRHTYRKFTTSIGGDFLYDRYLYDDRGVGTKRKDYVWRGLVGVDYHMQKWIQLGIKYRYTDLNSNFDAEDYGENLVSLFVGLSM